MAAAKVLAVGLHVPGVALGALVVGGIIGVFFILPFGDFVEEALLDLEII